jgi:hypothetical protein
MIHWLLDLIKSVRKLQSMPEVIHWRKKEWWL